MAFRSRRWLSPCDDSIMYYKATFDFKYKLTKTNCRKNSLENVSSADCLKTVPEMYLLNVRTI